MNKFQKILTIGIIGLSQAAIAADFQSGDLYYNVLDATGKTVEVTKPSSGSYSLSKVEIPSTVSNAGTDYKVVAVGNEAFWGVKTIMTVSFPEGLKSIGKKAFYGCISLTDFTLPSTLESIGGSAFNGCQYLTEVTIPGSVKEWGIDYSTYSNIFADCYRIEKVVVEEGVTRLPDSFLSMPGTTGTLKEIELSSTLTDATNAFIYNFPMSVGAKVILKAPVVVPVGSMYTHSWDNESAYENAEIYVPAEVLDQYKADPFWSQFKRLQAIGATGPVAPAPYKNIIGLESGSYVSFSMRWNDNIALDNLTELVFTEEGATVKTVIATVLREDDRFYAMNELESGKRLAYGFDTNGDHSRGIYVDGERKFMNAGLGYSVVWQKDLEKAGPITEYDHWKVNSDTHEWKVFVNGEPAADETVVRNGDNVIVEYTETGATAPSEMPYTFYLRPGTTQGIWTLEEITIDTANGKSVSVPALCTLGDDTPNLYGAYLGIEFYETDGTTSTNAYTGSFTYRNTDKMSCTINVSKPVEALVRPYLNIRKDWGDGTTATRRVYPDVDSRIKTTVAKPLAGIGLEGIEPGGVIEVDNMGVFIIKPVYEPADADFTGYTASFENTAVATLYPSVNSIVAHSAGETTMTISSPDGLCSSKYTVKVKDVDPENRPENFMDGMVWLNEEWFGHTSGSLNYIDANGDLYCRAYGNQNNNMAFGATSQFGMNYAGKYIIMSKQAWDNGDTRPDKSGGRVVVFDAETFKNLGAIDEIGGDGRSCVGVSPSKIYLGTAKGIRVMDLDNITVSDNDIAGITVSRSGQIGDMVKSGKYVFASNIGTGLEIIDTTTDTYVKTISSTGIQGVVQSADGRVWIGCAKTLTAVNPETLEVEATYDIPGSITCSSYSWRSVNLLAAHNSNTLFWGTGTFYRWDLDEVEDPSALTPVFTHTSKVGDITYGSGYGAPGYDDRTGTYMFATMPGFGAAALQNWYHFVDAKTGEVKSRIKLPEYWWFPAMPIAPDKHLPEIDLKSITLTLEDGAKTFDLREYVSDKDNHDCNISLSLAENSTAATAAAEAVLEGNTLTVTPLEKGKHIISISAESNGRTSTNDIEVTVTSASGITPIEGQDIQNHVVFNVSGVRIAEFTASGADGISALGLPSGVYIVRSANGETTKKIIR